MEHPATVRGEQERRPRLAGPGQGRQPVLERAVHASHRHPHRGPVGQVRAVQARHEAVDRVHLGAEGGGVDQQAEASVPRATAVTRRVAELLPTQVGGVAVVPVGDQGLACVQVRRDGCEGRRVRQRPEPVAYAVAQEGVHQQRALIGPSCAVHRADSSAGRPAAVVDQEDRLQVGADGRVQGKPIAHRAGHRALVRQDDPVLRRAESEHPHQPALDVPARFGLLVDVQRGHRVRREHPARPPRLEQRSRARVPVLTWEDAITWKDEPDDVVLAQCFEGGGLVSIDDVVRRTGHVCKVTDDSEIEAQGSKR